jgi:polysaccharide pyruvyl transferase WcaK-like protein
MKPRITVLGWYGKKNCGDESYKMAFPQIFPEYDFRFVDVISPKVVEESDGFVLGGGDILAPQMVAQLDGVNKPKHVISATASNPNVPADKLKAFESIFVRDYASIELLQEKGVHACWLPDVAMVLRGNPKKGQERIKNLFARNNSDKYDKVVVVVVNSYLLNEDHPESETKKFVNFMKFAQEMASVCDSTPASFLFLPFGGRMPFDDRISGSFVASKCKFWQKNAIVFDDPDVQAALDIFAAADCVVSTRLHSSILACGQGTPFLDVTWNHKGKWFLETVGQQKLSMSYRSFDAVGAAEMIDDMLFNGDDIRKELAAVARKQTAIVMNSTKYPLAEAPKETK